MVVCGYYSKPVPKIYSLDIDLAEFLSAGHDQSEQGVFDVAVDMVSPGRQFCAFANP
jgi:hypothetical protein